MNNITRKLKSFITTGILIAAVLMAMTFAKSFRSISLQAFQVARKVGTAGVATSGRQPANQNSPASALPATATTSGQEMGPQDLTVTTQDAAYLGHWHAQWNSPKQGFCEISIEVKSGTATKYVAYPTFSCLPISPLLDPESKAPASAIAMPLGRLNPASAILTGDLKDGSLIFEVTKVTSANDTGCVLTSPFTLTLFGSNQVASVSAGIK